MIKTDTLENIPEVLESLSKVSSTNEKKKILLSTKSDNLKYIFKQAYDSFINFGTVKVDVSGLQYTVNCKLSTNWLSELKELLSKLEKRELTGNHARDEIRKFMEQSPEEWADIVLKILKKDLRIGAGKRLINHVYKNLFSEDFCMAAMKFDKKRFSYPVYADIKLDGVRCIADIKDENVNLFSRNGRLFKNYPFIAEEIKELDLTEGTKLDGEITSSHFQELMRTVSRKEGGIELAKDAVYNIFDIIKENEIFEDRLEYFIQKLEKEIEEKKLKHIKIIKGKEINTEEELFNFYQEQIEKGHEGIMIKSFDGVYEFKRSYAWQKMKPEQSEDLEILRVEPGTGKYAKVLGAIICKLTDGNEVSCGSGFTDEEREEFWNKRKELIGQIVEIKYQERTRDNSLRFPVFVKFRFDKL